MAVSTYESQTVRTNAATLDNSPGDVDTYAAQNFTPTLSYTVWQIQIKAQQHDGTTPDIKVNIYAADGSHEPTGSSLGEAIIVGGDVPVTYDWVIASFSSGIDLTGDTEYVIVVNAPDADGSNDVQVGYSTGNQYANGYYLEKENGSWTHRSTWDLTFKVQGYPSIAPPTSDAYTSKRLITCASDEVWVETAAGGTMEQLTDSIGQLDTSDYLDICELFGKAFIVNKSIKKVVDLINVKITTADLGANPPDFGTVLEGGTSGAQMAVDYITSLDDDEACTIYGKSLNAYTFSSGETVTGTDDDGNAISFVLNANEVSGPHFYDWSVYGNSTDYGVMPDNGTIVCNYRGRPVISGDPLYPHQWYMGRQGNPWNWLYGVNDAQSAVAGNNADAGEVGDIIRALIPYKDDYLLFGCDNSIWYLIGDPCDGGSIEPFDLTTGIYGPKAWCFDGAGNFYFWGRNGLYKSLIPGKPICISEIKLPNLINDESADQSTHRIVLTFDPNLKGIIISITTLADGTNSNYWYDLRALDDNEIGGFFPEEYPEECAIFSSFFYESKDSNYRKLILGCNDGYLKFFDSTVKNDNIGDTTETIDSYIDFGPIPMANDPKFAGILTGLFCETGGGASGGSQSDSDNLYYKIFTAKSASEVIEKLYANTNPSISGTFLAPGRKHGHILRKKIKNICMGIKVGNSTAGESWALEQIVYDLKKSGKFK